MSDTLVPPDSMLEISNLSVDSTKSVAKTGSSIVPMLHDSDSSEQLSHSC